MATRGDLISFAKQQSRNFDQKCQAWTWQVCARFGSAPVVYPSANAAYRASKIVSKDPSKAPAGAIHYWNLSVYGHVAPGTSVPGEVLMATGHDVDFVNRGAHLGLVKVFDYNRAAYLGWSLTNGRNSFKLTMPTPKPAAKPDGRKMPPKTATAVNGRPGAQGHSNCWVRLQVLASHGGYTGPWDGFLPDGGASYRGLQTYLKAQHLYAGDVDGKPRKLTVTALQRWAGVKNPTVTDSLARISPANWRKIGAKLNTLK